jgi:hypothetical protein
MIARIAEEPELLRRFWANVDPVPTASGCRLWLGRVDATGRPAFAVGYTTLRPARIVWSLTHRESALGGHVYLSCGEQRCLAAEHMRWVASRRTRALNDGARL